MALITNSNFSDNKDINDNTGDVMLYDTLVDLYTELSINKALDNRSAFLMPTYAGQLKKDSVLTSANSSAADVIRSGSLGPLAGFTNVYEYAAIPHNSENLVGFACSREALLIAARQPAVTDQNTVQVENVTDPVTGLPLQLRLFYVPQSKKTYLTVEVMYGVAVGVAGNLVRLVDSTT